MIRLLASFLEQGSLCDFWCDNYNLMMRASVHPQYWVDMSRELANIASELETSPNFRFTVRFYFIDSIPLARGHPTPRPPARGIIMDLTRQAKQKYRKMKKNLLSWYKKVCYTFVTLSLLLMVGLTARTWRREENGLKGPDLLTFQHMPKRF